MQHSWRWRSAACSVSTSSAYWYFAVSRPASARSEGVIEHRGKQFPQVRPETVKPSPARPTPDRPHQPEKRIVIPATPRIKNVGFAGAASGTGRRDRRGSFLSADRMVEKQRCER